MKNNIIMETQRVAILFYSISSLGKILSHLSSQGFSTCNSLFCFLKQKKPGQAKKKINTGDPLHSTADNMLSSNIINMACCCCWTKYSICKTTIVVSQILKSQFKALGFHGETVHFILAEKYCCCIIDI